MSIPKELLLYGQKAKTSSSSINKLNLIDIVSSSSGSSLEGDYKVHSYWPEEDSIRLTIKSDLTIVHSAEYI